MVKDSYQNIANGLTNDVLLAISAGLSILGCTLILTTYMCYKEIRTVSRHIVVCISISDIITTASNLSAIFISPEIDSETDEIDNISCTVQSFVGTSAVLWSFLWTMVLAMYLYLDLVKENKTLGKRLIWPWSHLICWIAPLGINMIALFLHKLGNSGDRNTAGWCWISVFVDNYGDAKLWMLVDGKGIELLTYVVIVILYSRMKLWSIRQIKIPKQNEGSHLLQRNSLDAARYTDKKIILIPILFVLLRIWGTIRFFMLLRTETLAFKGDITVFETALLYLQTIGDNLQGAINCILFCCMTPVVRKRINKSVTSMRRQRFHLYDHLDSTSDTSSRIYQPID